MPAELTLAVVLATVCPHRGSIWRIDDMAAGYSGTSLVRKLGIKPGHRIATVNEPPEFRELLDGLPNDAVIDDGLVEQPDISVAFFARAGDLDSTLPALAQAAFPDRVIWLAWPKKTSNVDTDLTGDVVRATVLRTHLVDVKVCAISDVWSGLKVVWRKEHRHKVGAEVGPAR
jgi:hypothetical protein